MIRAAINALAYSAGFALGRVELHYRRSVTRIVPDDLTAIAEATGVLVPTPAQAAERQAMRARLIDDLCAEFGREVDACLPEYVAEWEAL